MLGQTAELKMEKFIDTMPTIIQTHLITCKTWAKTTKKVKELEHIIRKCDPLKTQYNYDDTNNYYHNKNYRGQSRGHRPYRGQNTGQFFRGQNSHDSGNAIKIHTKANVKTLAIKAIITKVIEVYIITHAEFPTGQ